MTRFRSRLAQDDRGATIIEFAMILPALCIILLATFELGYRMYVSAVLQGALHEAARLATIGNQTTTQIDAHVRRRLLEFSHQATITTSIASYTDFTHVAVPELITADSAPTGEYNEGDCYEDYNNNSRYDLERGRSGLGQADDVVRYEVSISYPALFPVAKLMGWSNQQIVKANTALRNQPYAGRSIPVPPVRCT